MHQYLLADSIQESPLQSSDFAIVRRMDLLLTKISVYIDIFGVFSKEDKVNRFS